jgi:hypothetical protein
MRQNYFSSCFVDRASRYNRVKKTQLDAQLILSIFHQPPHVSGVSRPMIRRYNRMYTTIGIYYSVPIQPGQHSHLKRLISTKCCTHTILPPDGNDLELLLNQCENIPDNLVTKGTEGLQLKDKASFFSSS